MSQKFGKKTISIGSQLQCHSFLNVEDVLTNARYCLLTATCPRRGGVSPAEGPTPPAPPPPPPQQQPQPDGYWNMHLEVLRSGSINMCLYLLLGFVGVFPFVLMTCSDPHFIAWSPCLCFSLLLVMPPTHQLLQPSVHSALSLRGLRFLWAGRREGNSDSKPYAEMI